MKTNSSKLANTIQPVRLIKNMIRNREKKNSDIKGGMRKGNRVRLKSAFYVTIKRLALLKLQKI